MYKEPESAERGSSHRPQLPTEAHMHTCCKDGQIPHPYPYPYLEHPDQCGRQGAH